MSLLDEFERILAQEEAKRSEADPSDPKAEKTPQGLLGEWMASFREWKASIERRPRG